MIRHIVLVRFKPEVSETRVAEIFGALPKLSAKLSGVINFTCGRSESPEKMERGFMHGFTIDFSSWEALANYADDPDHKVFGGQLVGNAVGGVDGILVFDLEVK